jgi:hypothetical protein
MDHKIRPQTPCQYGWSPEILGLDKLKWNEEQTESTSQSRKGVMAMNRKNPRRNEEVKRAGDPDMLEMKIAMVEHDDDSHGEKGSK